MKTFHPVAVSRRLQLMFKSDSQGQNAIFMNTRKMHVQRALTLWCELNISPCCICQTKKICSLGSSFWNLDRLLALGQTHPWGFTITIFFPFMHHSKNSRLQCESGEWVAGFDGAGRVKSTTNFESQVTRLLWELQKNRLLIVCSVRNNKTQPQYQFKRGPQAIYYTMFEML